MTTSQAYFFLGTVVAVAIALIAASVGYFEVDQYGQRDLTDLGNRTFNVTQGQFPWIDNISQHQGGVKHASFENCRGLRLHAKFYEREGNERIIIFFHGLGAHVNRAPVNEKGLTMGDDYVWCHFVDAGYDVYSYDAEGHGLSEGTKHYIMDWHSHVDDGELFVRLLQMRRGNTTPFYIMGESFGGTVAFHLSLRLSEEQSGAGGEGRRPSSSAHQAYRGTFFIAPALQAVMPPKIVVWTLRYGLAPFFPKWIPPFMPDNLAVENIWEDQSVAHWYKTKDELGDPEGKLRLGTALQVLLSMEDAMEKVKAGKVTFPWACVHGTKDLVIDIEGSRTLFQYSSCAARANANSTVLKVKKDSDSDADADVDSNSCSKRAELYVLEGAMHDPLGAPQTPEVIQIMLQWLKNDQLSEK